MSPKRVKLIGIAGIVRLAAELGKVNQKTGQPLTEQRFIALIEDWSQPHIPRDRRFPKPYAVTEDGRRLWREEPVLDWLTNWDQQPGKPPAVRREG